MPRDTSRPERRATACLLGALLALPAAGPAQPLDTEQVLERMSRTSESFDTLAAELVQTRSFPMLEITDPPERGTVFVRRRGGGNTDVRLEMAPPSSLVITVRDRSYVYYQPRIKQAILGELEPGRIQQGASFVQYLVGDLRAIAGDYEIETLGQETIDDHATLRLRLTPRPEARSYYSQVDLWVDTELWFPIRQQLTEYNNTVTRIDLRDLRFDVALGERLFEQDLPRDVERVRG